MNGATIRRPWNAGTKRIALWGTRNVLPVDPSDRHVRKVFTTGQCHSLSFALHALTGWPVVLLCEDYDDYDAYDEDDAVQGDPNSWAHAVVRSPWGTYVDIEGEWALDENDSWCDMYAFEAGTPEDAMDYIGSSGDLVQTEKALPFARAIIAGLDLPA